MALEVLHGARAQDIPIENARLVPTFDWRQLRRWGIDESRIPSGANIQFRVPTMWESYREYIVGATVVIAAQLLLIAGLLTQRASRRRAEQTILKREAALRRSYERIRELSGRLIDAQEAARAEIARELHDDVCQQLVGVAMAVSGLKRSAGHLQDAAAQEALSDLQQRAQGMVEGVRRLSHDLHPATLRLVGPAAALAAHCREVEKRYGVEIGCRTIGNLEHLPPPVALCVFRIAQEALRNGAEHGRARLFAVSLARTADGVELTVTDDGRGFDLEAVRRDGRGLGLISMEERAHRLGGDLRVVTRLGEGTTLRLRIPEQPVRDSAVAQHSDLMVAVRTQTEDVA
jgi:signal transduction histidine kinase